MIVIDDNKGWISVYRTIQDCWIWKETPFSKGQAWIDLLLLANHEDKKILFDGELITVQRGQRITSIRQLADRWGWSRDKVSKFLNILESDLMLTQQRDNKKTLITITNYNIYQVSQATEKPQKSHRKATTQPQTDTNNNDNNYNNDNKYIGEKSNRFIPPILEEVKAYCKERNNNVDTQRFIDFYSAKGWMVGKNKMKDWKAAARTWEKDSKPVQQTIQTKPNKFHNFEQTTSDLSEKDFEEIAERNNKKKLERLGIV